MRFSPSDQAGLHVGVGNSIANFAAVAFTRAMAAAKVFDRKSVGTARFPEGRVGFAIGDIHGRADLLLRMLDQLEQERAEVFAPPPIAIFLGDYVDRGPDSANVIELLLGDRPRGFERRFLLGNHEASMLAFLQDAVANRAWLLHGGVETLISYGIEPPSDDTEEALQAVAGALSEKLPASHHAFLGGLERSIVLGDYFFTHAGVDPAKPLDDQTDDALLWSRARFLTNTKPLPYRIVHGHTPVAAPYEDYRRIGVDTGAYATGLLSAARFEGVDVTFVSVRMDR